MNINTIRSTREATAELADDSEASSSVVSSNAVVISPLVIPPENNDSNAFKVPVVGVGQTLKCVPVQEPEISS